MLLGLETDDRSIYVRLPLLSALRSLRVASPKGPKEAGIVNDARLELLLQHPGLCQISVACIRLRGDFRGRACHWTDLHIEREGLTESLGKVPLAAIGSCVVHR